MLKLTEEQIATYREEGVLIAENIFTDDDLQPVIDEMSRFIDRRASELKAENKIGDLHEDKPFETRFALLYAQCKEISHGIDIMQMRGKAMFEFLRNDNLMDAVEDLIGGEILCNPIQHIRAKFPRGLSPETPDYYHNVPWHQDAGVTWQEADPTEILTCWLPLVDATVENGCMEVLPGAWRSGHLDHQKEGGTQIVPEQMPAIAPRAAVCPKGGLIIMNKYTPHRSTNNNTEAVRWSIDLRYQPIGLPTGRPFQPAFITRSRKNPETVCTSHEEWCTRWIQGLENSKGIQAHRVVK